MISKEERAVMRSSRTVTFLLLVALGTALLVPGAHAQSSGQKRTRVRMAQSADGYVSVPTYVAQARGFFEAEGIDLELSTVGGGPAVLNTLVGGSVDAGYSAFEHVVKAKKSNVNLVGVAVTVLGIPFVLVVTNAAAKKAGVEPGDSVDKRMKAMKGMRLGFSAPGSQSENVLKLLLKKAGLDPAQDAILVPLRTELNMVSAFRTNQVDGLLWVSPLPEKLLHEKLGVVILSGPRGEMPVYPGNAIFDHLYFTERYVQENPAVVQGMVTAYMKAVKFTRENPKEVVEIVKRRFPKEEPEVVALSMQTMQPMLTADLAYQKADAEATIAGIVEGVDPMSVVTNRFVDEARKRVP
jgi:NitT/TauT family transport system substrate-binding protein